MTKTRILSCLLAIVVLVLLAIGILVIYSTTYAVASRFFLNNQLKWVLISSIAVLIIIFVPLPVLSRLSKLALIGVLLPLAYLALAGIISMVIEKVTGRQDVHVLPFALTSHGACRWLSVGGFTIQPSEFTKPVLILFLSTYYGMRETHVVKSFREGFLLPACVVGLTLLLILLGRSLSVTLISGAVAASIMYLAGVRLRYMLTAGLLCAMLCCCSVVFMPYRMKRINNFIVKHFSHTALAEEKKETANNEQLDSAQIAIGSGGLHGLGFGQGRLKHKSIPEARTDFILAVVGEEFGFVGLFVCILLFLAFMFLCFAIAQTCRDRQSMLICLGVGVLVPMQAMLNLGVISGVLPTTGIPVPFISYGGSSLLAIMGSVALVFNVCHQNFLAQRNAIVAAGDAN
ncbi:MAG: FtsW/RodA/SpoVE family cell cycle protein [Victivallales bacterium]|nr:FtsW/RodA/SpoVE family cell cycle protein [Victivallales bacterium]